MAHPIFSTTCTCTFVWKIENFNYLWLKRREKIDSPAFEVYELGNTEWMMRLYRRGYSFFKDIEFYLCRNEEDNGVRSIGVYFELEFLSEDSSILFSLQSEFCTFYKGSFSGFESLVNRENVHDKNKDIRLSLNTLTARCKIWRNGGTFPVDRYFFAHTSVIVQQISFRWQIANFSSISSDDRKILDISSFTKPPNPVPYQSIHKENLTLHLDLTGGRFSEEVIDIHIDISNMDAKYLCFKTFIFDTYGRFKNSGVKEFLSDDSEKKGTLTLLLSKKQLMADGKYLKNDVLTLYCDCIYSTGMFSKAIDFGRVGSASFLPVIPLVQNVAGFPTDDSENIGEFPTNDVASLREDFESLYNCDALSDMKLRTNTNTIPVHTQILGARSPVFRAMFTNDMKEKIEGCIDVPDLDDDTVTRMLLYMYTDKVEDLQWENASQLYAAADKYDIVSLRRKCGAILQAKLSPTNACQILTLSDTYQDEGLKKAVQDYIVMQGKTIFSSEEWKLFMKTNLQLAAEIMYQNCNKD